MVIKQRKWLTHVIAIVVVGAIGIPTAIPAQAEKTSAVQLSPCKFDVGFGNAKTGTDAQCTVISVPEDRARPNGRKIDLHVTVLAATGPNKKPEPIFHFEGGPGASAITNFGQTFFSAYRLLREDHDIVLLDQRGTGLSSPLNCTEDTSMALQDLSQSNDDTRTLSTAVDRISACLKRLSATTDPAFYTSTILADDTDDVRAALGYDQIDVIGVSYGTWLAQIYLRRHGDHVHAMVLDSLAGPWDFYLLDAATNAQAALNKIFALCQSDSECNTKYPNLPVKLQQTLDKLDKAPAKTTGLGTLTGKSYPVTMTRSRFLESLRSMLYQAANISVIPQMITQAASGDFTLIAAEAVLNAEVAPEIALGLYYSVHCSESLPFYTPKLIAQYNKNAFYGLETHSVEQLTAICKAWRSAELSAADVAPVKSDRPVLIMVGAFDPITAPVFADESHRRLSHSSLALFPYQAHGPIVGSKCAQTITETFLTAPDKPVDTSCTAKDVKPIFLGAYNVDLVPYSDPNGAFSVNVPKGWAVQSSQSSGPLTFFASPDGVQLLGIGVFKNTKADVAQKAALDAIAKAYGPVDVQFSQSFLFVTIIQAGLDRPDQAAIGALLIRSLGTDTQVVWQSAPPNIFQAALLPVAVQVFASLSAR